MNASSQDLSEERKYTLSLRDGTIKDCIYEGICGARHCFTTKQNDDAWAYYFLAETDFRASGSNIEVLANQPERVPISKEKEAMEFLQIQQAWNRVMGIKE